MAKNFASIAFTDPVKSLQEKNGSRASYARMEQLTHAEGLTENEIDFISQRDSLYIASIGGNGFPYIQHRGGPKGFIKVLDAKRIAFIDFKGNMQYITAGNIETNKNISLIMVDYPARARLKIYAKSEIVELKDNAALYDALDLKKYKFRPEQMMVLHIEAYDWNCPQHITPRYTAEDIEEAFAGQRKYMAKLEAEIKELKQALKEKEVN
jgi:uncharacterized protein